MLSAAFFARGFSIAPRHGRRRGCTPVAQMRWMWPGGGGDVRPGSAHEEGTHGGMGRHACERKFVNLIILKARTVFL